MGTTKNERAGGRRVPSHPKEIIGKLPSILFRLL